AFLLEVQAAVIHAASQRPRVVRRKPDGENSFAPALEVRRHWPVRGRLQQLELALARLNDRPGGIEKAQVVFLDHLRTQHLRERIGSDGTVPHRKLHPIDALEHPRKMRQRRPWAEGRRCLCSSSPYRYGSASS